MANKLFDSILAAQRDVTEGKALGLELAIVTANNDPLNLNRIKVTTAARGALSETDWLYNISLASGYSVTKPVIGSTVVIGYLDANPHTPVYLGTLHNQLNPPNPGFTVILDNEQPTETFRVQCGSMTLTVDSTGVRINGKLVAVVGSTDSRNDVIVQANQ